MDQPPNDTLVNARGYREQLTVPWWWWLIALGLAGSAVVAVGAFLGPRWALVSALVSVAAVMAALLPWHLTTILVQPDQLKAGGAHISWEYIERAEPLSPAQTRTRLGPQADVRDWLLVRPYLDAAVEVTLSDPADPHPAWLIHTRQPERLAQVINDHLGVVQTAPGPRQVDRLKDSPVEGDVR